MLEAFTWILIILGTILRMYFRVVLGRDISGATTASKVPVPLCEKGAAEREAAINVSVLSGPFAFYFRDHIVTS